MALIALIGWIGTAAGTFGTVLYRLKYIHERDCRMIEETTLRWYTQGDHPEGFEDLG